MPDIVLFFRDGHANVDSVNKISQTPLMYAVVEEHPSAVKAILEAGRPDLTLGNKLHWDWAPAHWAVMKVFLLATFALDIVILFCCWVLVFFVVVDVVVST